MILHNMFQFFAIVHAQAPELITVTPLAYQTGGLMALIMGIINWFFVLGGGVAVIFVVFGGLQYVTAGSDETKTEEARQTITNAVIGIAIIAFSFTIINWLSIVLLQTTTKIVF